jgi:hypothetical protein
MTLFYLTNYIGNNGISILDLKNYGYLIFNGLNVLFLRVIFLTLVFKSEIYWFIKD